MRHLRSLSYDPFDRLILIFFSCWRWLRISHLNYEIMTDINSDLHVDQATEAFEVVVNDEVSTSSTSTSEASLAEKMGRSAFPGAYALVDEAQHVLIPRVEHLLNRAEEGMDAMTAMSVSILETVDKITKMFVGFESYSKIATDVIVILIDLFLAIKNKAYEFIPTLIVRVLNVFNVVTTVATHLATMFMALVRSRESNKDLPEPQAVAEANDIDPVASVLSTIVGTIFMGRLPNSTDIRSVNDKFRLMYNVQTQTKNVVSFISSMLRYLPNVVKEWLSYVTPTEWYCKMFMPGEPYFEWIQRVDDIRHIPEVNDVIVYDANLQQRIKDLHREGGELVQRMIALNTPQSNKILMLLRDQMKIVEELYQVGVEGLCSHEMRPVTYCLYTVGTSGIGKSQMSAIFGHKLAGKYLDDANVLYSRNPMTDFWDRYRKQDVVIFDDFGQTNGPTSGEDEYSQIFSMISPTPYSLNMASLNDKGKVFKSPYLILSSNTEFCRPNTILHPQALWRRRNLMIKMRVLDQYLQNGRLDPRTFEAGDMSIYRFQIHRDPGDPNAGYLPGEYTYDEMIHILERSRDQHWENQAKAKRTLEMAVGYRNPQAIVEGLMEDIDRHLTIAEKRVSTVAQKWYEDLRVELSKMEVGQEPEWKKVLKKILPIVAGAGALLGLALFGTIKAVKKFRARSVREVVKVYTSEGMEDATRLRACLVPFEGSVAGNILDELASRIALLYNLKGTAVTDADKEEVLVQVLGVGTDQVLKDVVQRLVMTDDADQVLSRYTNDQIPSQVKNFMKERAMCLQKKGGDVTKRDIDNMYEETLRRVIRGQWDVESAYAGPKVTPRVIPSVVVAQALTDSNAHEIVMHKIEPNLVTVKTSWDFGDREMVGFFISGRCMLVPWHLVSYNKQYIDYRGIITVTTSDGLTFSEYFDQTRARRIENCADGVIYCFGPTMRQFMKTTTHFIHEADLAKMAPPTAYLCTRRKGKFFFQTCLNVKRMESAIDYYSDNSNLELVVIQAHRGWEYAAQTDRGYCGSLLVAQSNQYKDKILGMHVASRQSGDGESIGIGISVLVTHEMIEKTLKEFGVQILGIHQPARVEGIENLKVFPRGDHFSFFGKMEKPLYIPNKTKLRKSLLYGKVCSTDYAPAVLDRFDPRNKSGEDPLFKAISKYGDTPLPIDARVVREVGLHVNKILERWVWNDARRLLSTDEVVNGVAHWPSYERLNLDTSPGYPYITRVKQSGERGKHALIKPNENGVYKIIDGELLAKTVTREKEAKQGRTVQSAWVDTPKDELRTTAKIRDGNTRSFTVGPLDFSLVIRKYTGAFVAGFYANFENFFSAVGINPESLQWQSMYYYLASNGTKCIAGDYERYDGRLHPDVIWEVCEIINRWYDDGEENATVRRVLFNEIIHTPQIAGPCAFMTHVGNPSGNPLTSVLNTLAGAIHLRYVWKKLAPVEYQDLVFFEQNIRDKVYGDDNILTVSELASKFYNPEGLTRVLATMGLKYTAADKSGEAKFTTIEEQTFLKRGFARDYRGTIVAQIAMPTIHKIINWIRESDFDTPEGMTVVNVNQALHFLYFYGKQIFDDYAVKICNKMPKKSSFFLSYYHFDNMFYMESSTEIGGSARVPLSLTLPVLMKGATVARAEGYSQLPLRSATPVIRCELRKLGENSLTQVRSSSLERRPTRNMDMIKKYVPQARAESNDFANVQNEMGAVIVEQHPTTIDDGSGKATAHKRLVAGAVHDQNWTISQVTQKRIMIDGAPFPFSVTDTQWQILKSIELPGGALTAEFFAMPFEKFLLFNGGFKFWCEHTGSPFYAGKLLLVYVPRMKLAQATRVIANNHSRKFYVANAVADINAGNTAELLVPYHNIKTLIYTQGPVQTGWDFMGSLFVIVYNPLRTASTQPPSIDVSLFCALAPGSDFRIPASSAAPLYVPSLYLDRTRSMRIVENEEQHERRIRSGISKGEQEVTLARRAVIRDGMGKSKPDVAWEDVAAAHIAMSKQSYTPLARAEGNSSSVYNLFSAGGNIESTVKPEQTTSVQASATLPLDFDGETYTGPLPVVRLEPLDHMVCGNMPKVLQRLHPEPSTLTRAIGEKFGTNQDEMSFDYQMNIPGYVTTFQVSTTDIIGTVLYEEFIGPGARFFTPKTTFQRPMVSGTPFFTNAVDYLSKYHQNWTGSLNVYLSISATIHHRGRLLIYRAPGVTPGTITTVEQAQSQFWGVVEISKETREMKFNLPYDAHLGHLDVCRGPQAFVENANSWTQYFTGCWGVMVMHPLRATSDVSQFIDVNYFISKGDDFNLHLPWGRNLSLLPMVYLDDAIPPAVDEEEEREKEVRRKERLEMIKEEIRNTKPDVAWEEVMNTHKSLTSQAFARCEPPSSYQPKARVEGDETTPTQSGDQPVDETEIPTIRTETSDGIEIARQETEKMRPYPNFGRRAYSTNWNRLYKRWYPYYGPFTSSTDSSYYSYSPCDSYTNNYNANPKLTKMSGFTWLYTGSVANNIAAKGIIYTFIPVQPTFPRSGFNLGPNTQVLQQPHSPLSYASPCYAFQQGSLRYKVQFGKATDYTGALVVTTGYSVNHIPAGVDFGGGAVHKPDWSAIAAAYANSNEDATNTGVFGANGLPLLSSRANFSCAASAEYAPILGVECPWTVPFDSLWTYEGQTVTQQFANSQNNFQGPGRRMHNGYLCITQRFAIDANKIALLQNQNNGFATRFTIWIAGGDDFVYGTYLGPPMLVPQGSYRFNTGGGGAQWSPSSNETWIINDATNEEYYTREKEDSESSVETLDMTQSMIDEALQIVKEKRKPQARAESSETRLSSVMPTMTTDLIQQELLWRFETAPIVCNTMNLLVDRIRDTSICDLDASHARMVYLTLHNMIVAGTDAHEIWRSVAWTGGIASRFTVEPDLRDKRRYVVASSWRFPVFYHRGNFISDFYMRIPCDDLAFGLRYMEEHQLMQLIYQLELVLIEKLRLPIEEYQRRHASRNVTDETRFYNNEMMSSEIDRIATTRCIEIKTLLNGQPAAKAEANENPGISDDFIDDMYRVYLALRRRVEAEGLAHKSAVFELGQFCGGFQWDSEPTMRGDPHNPIWHVDIMCKMNGLEPQTTVAQDRSKRRAEEKAADNLWTLFENEILRNQVKLERKTNRAINTVDDREPQTVPDVYVGLETINNLNDLRNCYRVLTTSSDPMVLLMNPTNKLVTELQRLNVRITWDTYFVGSVTNATYCVYVQISTAFLSHKPSWRTPLARGAMCLQSVVDLTTANLIRTTFGEFLALQTEGMGKVEKLEGGSMPSGATARV